MARAVARERTVPLSVLTKVPAIPECPGVYGLKHPDRKTEFSENLKGFPVDPQDISGYPSQAADWRHELDHDAESVFWLLLYWAMVVQPEGTQAEEINPGAWGDLLGDFKDRESLIAGLKTGKLVTHSFYEPLGPLIRDLASILAVDRHWLPASDPRNNLYYINEAFQRLILKFILEHPNEGFMHRRIHETFRRVKGVQDSHANSATITQSLDEENRNRVSCVYRSMNSCPFLLLCLQVMNDVQTDDDVEML